MACADKVPQDAHVFHATGTPTQFSNLLDKALPVPRTIAANSRHRMACGVAVYGSMEDMQYTCQAGGGFVSSMECIPDLEILTTKTDAEVHAQAAICEQAVVEEGDVFARHERCSAVANCEPSGKCRDQNVLESSNKLAQSLCDATISIATVPDSYYIDTGAQCVGPFTTYDVRAGDLPGIVAQEGTVDEMRERCESERGELVTIQCSPKPEAFDPSGPTSDDEFTALVQKCSALVPSDGGDPDEVQRLCRADKDCTPTAQCVFKPELKRTMAVPPNAQYDADDTLRTIGDCVDEQCSKVVVAPHSFDEQTGAWKRLDPDENALTDYFLYESAQFRCWPSARYVRRNTINDPPEPVTVDDGVVTMSATASCPERGDCADFVHRIDTCASDSSYNLYQQTSCYDPYVPVCDVVNELHGLDDRTDPALARTCTRMGTLKNLGVMSCAYNQDEGPPDPETFCLPWNPNFTSTSSVQAATDASADAYRLCVADRNKVNAEAFERACAVSEIKPTDITLAEPPCVVRSATGDNLCTALETMDAHITQNMGHDQKDHWQRVKHRTYQNIGCDVDVLRRLPAVPARCVANFDEDDDAQAQCDALIQGTDSEDVARGNCEGDATVKCTYQPSRDAATLLDVTNGFTDLPFARAHLGEQLPPSAVAALLLTMANKQHEFSANADAKDSERRAKASANEKNAADAKEARSARDVRRMNEAWERAEPLRGRMSAITPTPVPTPEPSEAPTGLRETGGLRPWRSGRRPAPGRRRAALADEGFGDSSGDTSAAGSTGAALDTTRTPEQLAQVREEGRTAREAGDGIQDSRDINADRDVLSEAEERTREREMEDRL